MDTTVGYADAAVVPAYLAHTVVWNVILTTAREVKVPISSFVTNLHLSVAKQCCYNPICTCIQFTAQEGISKHCMYHDKGHLRELQL